MTIKDVPHISFNPHIAKPTSFRSLAASLWLNRQLIVQMSKREILGRYRGSAIGLAWSVINPVLMLIIYTFVFSEIFKSKWSAGHEESSKTQFATLLFVGIIILNLISEVLIRAPGLILSNANYVKKVVFPLEILPIISIFTACFHCLISFTVLVSAFLLFNGFLNWTIIFLPLVLLPFLIFIAGVAWMLASLGVFLRDVGQVISIFMTIMMFLAPVFYPLSAVPDRFKPFLLANPPTFIIEQARQILIWGNLPNWSGLILYFFISLVSAWLGYAWFQKTRKGFADVL